MSVLTSGLSLIFTRGMSDENQSPSIIRKRKRSRNYIKAKTLWLRKEEIEMWEYLVDRDVEVAEHMRIVVCPELKRLYDLEKESEERLPTAG